MAFCSYREFLFPEICEQLSKKEVKNLAYSQGLPPDYLGKDGPEVLLKLESLDRFSEANLIPLVGMMKIIGRKDLSKKVEKFVKKNLQKQSKKKETSFDDLMMKQFQITSNSNFAQRLLKIISDQFKEIQIAATAIGNNKAAEVASSAVSIIDQQLLEKLSQIAYSVEQERCNSHDSMSFGSLLERDVETDPLPLVSHDPHQVEEHSYDYIGMGSLVPIPQEIHPIGQLVTGNDCPQPSKSKPPVAPKPKAKPSSTDYSSVVPSEESCTDDSGFEDATKFLKDPLKKASEEPKYQPMQADNREPVSYYTTLAKIGPDVDSEALYDDTILPNPKEPGEPIYANIPAHNKRHSSM